MLAHVHWDTVLITAASVGVFVLALCTAAFTWATSSLKRQIRDTVKPTFDALDETLREGFGSVATSMSDVKERVARLEGMAAREHP